MCCEIYFVLLQILLLNLAWKHCVTIIGISGVEMMFLEMLCQVSPGIVINLKIIIIISDNSCCAMHVRAEFRAKNAANVLLRNFAESCYWSQLPQLSYYKSENWFPSILRFPYTDCRPVFSKSQLITLRLPGVPGQQGCQSCHFIAGTFYDNPCETTMNTNIQAPPGDPVGTTDFRTFHMNIIRRIIKTAISQLSSY